MALILQPFGVALPDPVAEIPALERRDETSAPSKAAAAVANWWHGRRGAGPRRRYCFAGRSGPKSRRFVHPATGKSVAATSSAGQFHGRSWGKRRILQWVRAAAGGGVICWTSNVTVLPVGNIVPGCRRMTPACVCNNGFARRFAADHRRRHVLSLRQRSRRGGCHWCCYRCWAGSCSRYGNRRGRSSSRGRRCHRGSCCSCRYR